jgi:DNA invertase Pin-like site-specific DNA recombinase
LICKGLEGDKRAVQNSWRGTAAMMIGYARVSTDEQNLALQLDTLRGAGCAEIFQDTGSGIEDGRKGLAAALARCTAGDVLVVWKLDRLGRSLASLVGCVEALQGRDVGLKVLTGAGASIDTTKPEGRFILGVFAALAEFERELIRERTKAGMAAAKRRGRHVGRPRKLTSHKLEHARQLIADGRENKAGAAALLGVDPVTLRRALNEADDLQGSPARGKRPASVRVRKRV